MPEAYAAESTRPEQMYARYFNHTNSHFYKFHSQLNFVHIYHIYEINLKVRLPCVCVRECLQHSVFIKLTQCKTEYTLYYFRLMKANIKENVVLPVLHFALY